MPVGIRERLWMATPGACAAKVAAICGEQRGLSVPGVVVFADAKSGEATADLSV